MRTNLDLELDAVSGGLALHSVQAHAAHAQPTMPGSATPYAPTPYTSYGNDPFAGGYNLTPYASGSGAFPQAPQGSQYQGYQGAPYASDPYGYGQSDPYGYGQPQTIIVEQQHDNTLSDIGQIAGALGPIIGLFGNLANGGGSR